MDGSPLHIAYLIDEMKVGGTQRHIQGLIERLPDRWQASVLCLERAGVIGAALGEQGVPVEAFGCGNLWRPSGLAAVRRLRKRLMHDPPAVLHAFLGTACLLAPVLARGLPTRVVTSRRDTGFWMGRGFRWLARCVAKRADAITANSEAVRQAACRLEGLSADRIEVIPNGIDLPEAAGPETRMRVRRSLDLKEEQGVVAQVATLTPVKDHDTALAAVAALAPQHPALRWLFVGSGPRHQELEDKARALGVEAHVRFLGERQDVFDLLAASDVAVLTSRAEGFPNAVLEAMASGLPVVATDCGGVAELLPGETCGLRVPVGDAAGLARAVGALLADAERRRQMGAAARARVAEHFSWERTTQATWGLYERLQVGWGESCGEGA